MASPGVSPVTPLAATIEIAITEIAPIGMALPMIATIVPTNIASMSQAFGVSPSGKGITSQINRVVATAIAVDQGLKGSVGIMGTYRLKNLFNS